MKNKALRNALISGVLAVFSGVVLFGASVAFGENPTIEPPGEGVHPAFTGIDVNGGNIMVTDGGVYAENGVGAPVGYFQEINHGEDGASVKIVEDLEVVGDLDIGKDTVAEGTISADEGMFSGDKIRIFDGTSAEYNALKEAEDTIGIARKTGAVMMPVQIDGVGGTVTRIDMLSMMWNFVGPVNIEAPWPFKAYMGIIDLLDVQLAAVFRGPAGFLSNVYFDNIVTIADTDGVNDAKLIVNKIESSDGSGEGLLLNTVIKGPEDKLKVKGAVYADNFGRIYNVGQIDNHVVQLGNRSITVGCENPNDVIISCNLQTVEMAGTNIYSITYPSPSQCKMDYKEVPISGYVVDSNTSMNSWLVAKCWDMNGDGPSADSGADMINFGAVNWDFGIQAQDWSIPIDDTVDDVTFGNIYMGGPTEMDPLDLEFPNEFFDPLWDPIPEGSMGSQNMVPGY